MISLITFGINIFLPIIENIDDILTRRPGELAAGQLKKSRKLKILWVKLFTDDLQRFGQICFRRGNQTFVQKGHLALSERIIRHN